MSDRNNTGWGFWDVLQIVFIVLKLMKAISWSWWVVLLPIELSVAFWIVVVIVHIIGDIRK